MSGSATMGGPIELSEDEWHKTIDLNITGCYVTCKHVLPHILSRKTGAIVNISSIAAIRYTGYPYAAYYAAKAAVNNSPWDWRCNTRMMAFAPASSCQDL